MTILFPNYLQTQKYSAKKDRRVMSAAIMQEGIVHVGHYKVSQRGAGANLSVDVAAGEAWVDGDSTVDQGYYHVVNDATVNVPIATASAANPRIDAIVLAVNDSTEIGGSDEYKLESIAGTPTAAATLANLKGAPTPGATKLLLAYVLVAKEGTKVENAAIGALRDPRAGVTGYPAKAEPFAIAEAPPQYAHGRPLGYVPSCRVKGNAPTYGLLNWNEELWDLENMHDNVTNQARITARTPGIYRCTAQCAVGSGTPTWGILQFGATVGVATENFVEDLRPNSAQPSRLNVSGDIRLGYGDFITATFGNSVGSGAPSFGEARGMHATWIGP